LGGDGSPDMMQQAGTCGLYSLANGIAVAHNRVRDAQYRTAVKNKLLRIAGEQNALVTAQGELVSYEDIETVINAYNADQDNAPRDRVRLIKREAPENANAQDWRNTVGRSTDRNKVQKAFGWGNKSQNEVNRQQAGSIIAVDYNILSNYKAEEHTEQDQIPMPDVSDGAHWMTIVAMQGENITLHNSHEDKTETYPIWVVQQATSRLQNVSKDTYLNAVYNSDTKPARRNAAGFAKSNTKDRRNRDVANDDYETMLGEQTVRGQRRVVADRLTRTAGEGAHDVRLRNLIIRIRPA